MSLHLANSSLSPTERKQMDCGKKVFSFFKGGFLYVLCNYLRALWVHKYIIEQEAWSIYSVLESVLYSACSWVQLSDWLSFTPHKWPASTFNTFDTFILKLWIRLISLKPCFCTVASCNCQIVHYHQTEHRSAGFIFEPVLWARWWWWWRQRWWWWQWWLQRQL